MNRPPEKIDNATVLWWFYASESPVFVMPDENSEEGIEIWGLAICTYSDGSFYRFSCGKDWETINDGYYKILEAAQNAPSKQYDIGSIHWEKY